MDNTFYQHLDHSKDPFIKDLTSILRDDLAKEGLKATTVHHYALTSRSGLYQKLMKKIGISASGYLNILRIQWSCELLSNTKMCVQQVAYTVGYNDPNYYARVFKKWLGVSPKEYRKMKDKNQDNPKIAVVQDVTSRLDVK